MTAPSSSKRVCRSRGLVQLDGRAQRLMVSHRALGLCASNWKHPCVFVFPSEFNPECLCSSLANSQLDNRRPASETTQALSWWLHKRSRVQAQVLERLRAFANIWRVHEHEDTCEGGKPMHLFDSEHKEEDQNLAICGYVAGELWQYYTGVLQRQSCRWLSVQAAAAVSS